MIIESIHIKNFRSILEETLHCENLTALVGANGSGKSSFLRGLQLFYNPSPIIDIDDFYNRDTSHEIVIAVEFKELSQEAKELFSIYLQGEKLIVERVFSCENERISGKYHGATLQNLSFQPIHAALQIKDRGKSAKEAYDNIRSQDEYSSLPPWTTLGAVPENLREWETSHPENCTRQRDDGQFFGFKGVAQGYLGRFTRFLFIPAVRDAEDDSSEGRGSVFTELMDLVVRSTLSANEELKSFKQETLERYAEIINPASQTELSSLAERMTTTLKTFIPDSNVAIQLNWSPPSEINIPLPQADIKIVEDGYSSIIARTGHGLQRAFILTILQHLALAQTISNATPNPGDIENSDANFPDLVLAIEEPELYQHPNRQRHLAKILFNLASGNIPGVADNTQIIYGTHSPLFVGIDRIDQIRLFRKIPNEDDTPKITRIIRTTLDKVAEKIWEADGKLGQQYTGTT